LKISSQRRLALHCKKATTDIRGNLHNLPIRNHPQALRHHKTDGVAEIKIQESALSGTAFTLIIRVLQYGVCQRHTFY